jgi:hypothetical protein
MIVIGFRRFEFGGEHFRSCIRNDEGDDIA